MTKILFVCTANMDRSPTAERIYANHPGLEVKSAGTAPYARMPVSAELIQWADAVICMENHHLRDILAKYPEIVSDKIIDHLNITDDYDYMSDALINIIKRKMDAWLHEYHNKQSL